MNRFDSFSIAHLQLYLDAMSRKQKIVFWDELKKVIEICKISNLREGDKG